MIRTNLKGLTLSELEAYALALGEKSYRGKQLFTWLYTREASTFAGMTTLSKALREKLSAEAQIDSLTLLNRQVSRDDGTTKYLFGLSDGKSIESVLIPPRTAFNGAEARTEDEQRRLTLCVSTQAGCPLDCAFCATGTMGFLRNLTAGEIVDQVLQSKHLAGRQITNLVYMGMGEPLLNYDPVMKSIEIITAGMAIATRRITVSTAGLVPQIRKMADERRRMKLAVSLHSLDQHRRAELMPIARKYGIEELLGAVSYYYQKVKLRPTLEYILFDEWNDRDEDIDRLVKTARRIPCKINLIPFHSIAFTNPSGFASALRPTAPSRMDEFVRRLHEVHLTVFVRSSAGEDIDAACGQLAVAAQGTGRSTNRPHGLKRSSSAVRV